jgi:serralysin
MSFLAFDAAYRGGLYVSTGDINGDNQKDIVVASGIGARSHIKVFDGKTGAETASFYAFEEGFTGGSTVAVGDTDGDGVAEIVVGKGPGSEPLVRIFQQSAAGWSQRSEFLAFDRLFRGGVYVAVGDIGGDHRIEIAVGANAGANAAVAVFNAKTTEHLDQFYAYGQLDNVAPFNGGVRVAIEDYNRDGNADLITGAGPGGFPHLRAWDLRDLSQIASLLVAEDNYKGGVNLG